MRVQTVESHRIYRLKFTGLESPAIKGFGPEKKQGKVPEIGCVVVLKFHRETCVCVA